MILPTELSQEQVINNILLECADLEVVYPDPNFLEFAIGIWSHRDYPIWVNLYDTTQYDYNPIENYNRIEEWDEKGNETHHGTNEIAQKETGTLTDDNTINYGKNFTHQYNSTNTKSVSAYNSSNYEPSNQIQYGGSDTDKESGEDTGNNTQTRDLAFVQDTTHDNKRDNSLSHTGHIHGNIGVTTTQKMIQEQREIAEFNIINYITQSFKKEFCICVY